MALSCEESETNMKRAILLEDLVESRRAHRAPPIAPRPSRLHPPHQLGRGDLVEDIA